MISDHVITFFYEEGFTLKRALPIKEIKELKRLESTHYVLYKGKSLMQIQQNDSGTFNVFQHLEYQTTYHINFFNVTLDWAIEKAQEIVRHYFEEEPENEEEQLTIFDFLAK